jgi:hypothetical protein
MQFSAVKKSLNQPEVDMLRKMIFNFTGQNSKSVWNFPELNRIRKN